MNDAAARAPAPWRRRWRARPASAANAPRALGPWSCLRSCRAATGRSTSLMGRGRRRIGLVEGVEPHAGPVRGDRVGADHRELLQCGHVGLGDIGEDGREIDRAERSFDHHQPGAGNLEQMRDLGAAVARIDGGDDGPQTGGGEQQRDPFDPVDQPDRDHVALADTLRRKPGRGLLDLPENSARETVCRRTRRRDRRRSRSRSARSVKNRRRA